MSTFHLTTLEAVGLTTVLDGEQRLHLAHALGCRACAARLQRLLEGLPPGVREPAGGPLLHREPDYGQLWTRLAARVGALLPAIEAEQESAAAALPGLLRLPPVERNAAARPSAALAMLLLERSYQAAAFESPEKGEELAQLALRVAGRLEPPDRPWSLLADLAAHALALVGHARRLRRDFTGAEEAFGRAQEHVAQGIDPLTRATICRLLAPLRQEQGRYEEAESLLQRAQAIYVSVGQPPDAPRRARGTEPPGDHEPPKER